jgi:hypothetical protein
MTTNDLRLYDVRVGGHATLMRLNDTDAQAYGTDAVLAPEQVANGPVLRPTLAEPDADEPDPANLPAADSKARSAIHNKMRGTAPLTSPTPAGRPHHNTETE